MADLFVIRDGENAVAVEFQKLADSRNTLQVKLEVPDRFTLLLFHLTSSMRTSGQVEKKFTIENEKPPDFAAIEVTDDSQ